MSQQSKRLVNKVDISFLKSYRASQRQYMYHLLIYSIEISMLAIIMTIDIRILHGDNRIIGAFIALLATTFIQLIIELATYNKLFVSKAALKYYELAKVTKHLTNERVKFSKQIIQLTSQHIFYSQKNIRVNNQDTKVYAKYAQQQFKNGIQKKNSWLRCLNKIQHIIGFLSVVMGIILLSITSSTNLAQLCSLILFCVLEIYLRKKIGLVLFIILFSPLILVGGLFYVICVLYQLNQYQIQLRSSRREQYQNNQSSLQIALPQALVIRKPINSNTLCIICLTDIEITQYVYELKCSKEHVFHQKCLNQWNKYKSNCPSCRVKMQLPKANDN